MFFQQSKKQESEAAKFQAEILNMAWRSMSEHTEKTLKEVRETLKANPKDANALFTLGLYYKLGQGVKQDVYQACRYYIKAANEGHAQACYELAESYLKGNPLLGIDKNVATAREYIDKGIELGKGKEFNKQEAYLFQLKFLKKAVDNLFPQNEVYPTLQI